METQNRTNDEILAELERVRNSFPPELRPEPSTAGWLDRVFGIHADDLTFDEAIKVGKEWREGGEKKSRVTDNTQAEQVI